MTKFEEAVVIIPEGTILTSSKGFLYKSGFKEGVYYKVNRLRYLGDGHFEARGEKEEMDTTVIKLEA